MKKIQLTQGCFTIVDDDDFERLNNLKWSVWTHKNNYNKYAIRNIKNDKGNSSQLKIEHYILSKPVKGFVVDHKNGNSLDNRKENLRIVTLYQNRLNAIKRTNKKSSIYKGVYLIKDNKKRNKKWVSNISINKKRKSLGVYYTEKEAALAYNIAAKKYFGEFASLNYLGAN